jgi:DNA-binding MarR family transcriptional regulator
MPHSAPAQAFTTLVLETFRFHGQLLAAGDRLSAPFQLSSACWQVLGAVEPKPISVAQIARNMDLTRQGVQKLAGKLQQEKMIEYLPNPDHQRAKLVSLTESGRRGVTELTQHQGRWANRVAASLPVEEIQAAYLVLTELRQRLDNIPLIGWPSAPWARLQPLLSVSAGSSSASAPEGPSSETSPEAML